MAGATTGPPLTRITIVAPQRRFDIALPAEVPLADVLPSVLRYAGEDPLAGSTHGWALRRLGQPPLGADQPPHAYNIRDGELLYLSPASEALPEIVFDDVAEAIGRNAAGEYARWQPGTTRTFGVAAAGTLLALCALIPLLAGPGTVWSAIAGSIGLLLLATGIVLSRAVGDSGIGALLGFTALPYALVAGLFAPGEAATFSDLGTPHALSAATTVTIAALIALLGISDAVHFFLGTTAAGTLGAIGALIVATSDLSPEGAAALVAAVATALTPILPAVSLRLAQLPMPHIPADPDDVRHDDQPAYDATLLGQAHQADQYLTGLLSATALVVTVCDIVLITRAGGWGAALVGVMSVSLLLRARHLPAIAARSVLLISGLIGLGLVAAGVFVVIDSNGRMVLLAVALIISAIALLVGLRWPTARRSPSWASFAHIGELLFVVAIVPIALVVAGAYAWARARFG